MIKILAINKNTGEIEDITDFMYWFEENYIENLNDPDPTYCFEVYVDDKLVFTTKKENQESGEI